jgi:hypothetical protein
MEFGCPQFYQVEIKCGVAQGCFTFAVMANKPTFLLGLGMQKAGTTWMFRHLCRHPDTAFQNNLAKELGLTRFNIRRKPSPLTSPLRWMCCMRDLWTLKQQRKSGYKETFWEPVSGLSRKKALRRFSRSGAIHHQFLTHSGKTLANPRARIVGDIDPIYAATSKKALAALLKFLQADFEVKTFVIWRDPLARLDSAMKHIRRSSPVAVAQVEQFCVDGLFPSNTWVRHSNYVRTVETLNELFPDTHEMIYEELFGPEGQMHLTKFHQFAGIQDFPGDLGRQVHKARSDETGLTEEQKIAARGHLQNQYDVMENRLGRDRLASIWNL